MKKISLLLSLVLVLSLSVPVLAESSVEFSGATYFIFDEFTEVDGKQYYSMNGNTNIFGTGDWKKSTTDNPNDNREKFQNKLVLNAKTTVDNITIDMGFESLTDEFLGYPNGTGATRVQEAPTVRDNQPLRLKDLIVTADTEAAKITITNNFNYNFNDRVLATQFEDNWGEMNPYGEGILVESDMLGVATRGFVFQATKSDPGTPAAGNKLIPEINDGVSKPADKLVYGAEVKKDLGKGKIETLVVNTHDKSSDVKKTNDKGEVTNDYNQDKDILRAAVNGKYNVADMVTLNGEVITAQYGDDVEKVMNTRNGPWKPKTFDVGNKEETEVFEVGATAQPISGLEVSTSYTDVGEDYIAAVGADHSMDSWYGDANFNANDGTGYNKGLSLNASYMLPVAFTPTVTLEATDYEKTRSAFNGNEDTEEQEVEAGIKVEAGDLTAEASYRNKQKSNSGEDTVEETDLVYNDLNLNASYQALDTKKLTTDVHGDLNYYTGDDETIDQNFSTEKRVKVGTSADYKLNDVVTLTSSYDFGYATEDNDVFKNASGRQHLAKLGANYKINENTTFDVMYKYDNYKLDRDVTASGLENSVYKKEAEHHWYDSGESWEHGPNAYNWDGGGLNLQDVAPGYDGYITHEVKATLSVKF